LNDVINVGVKLRHVSQFKKTSQFGKIIQRIWLSLTSYDSQRTKSIMQTQFIKNIPAFAKKLEKEAMTRL